MKILNFEFEDKSLEWRLEKLTLNKLTLLVGASGVGKTQILRALIGIEEIASGEALNGVAWVLEFMTLNNEKYLWRGEFEKKSRSIFYQDDDIEGVNEPKIIFEELKLNNQLIVKRTSEKILFKGQPTVKLSQEKSILNLLKEEDLIKPAYESVQKLYFTDFSNSVNFTSEFDMTMLNSVKLTKKYDSLVKIQESNLGTASKLFFVSKIRNTSTFRIIQERFMDIFPQVESIKIAPMESNDEEIPEFLKDYPLIQIKEKGVKNWITQDRISSGMYRTLMQLSQLYLAQEGTVFLIDEFENSLGINCINEITEDVLASDRQLQFIITSHHPYIIDTIDYKNWKLVTRNEGIVKAHNVGKFNIGKSRHSSFMQLIQLDEYQTGRE